MPRLLITRRSGAEPSRFVVTFDIEREVDGRWIADVLDVPGAMAYGRTRDEAVYNAVMLALRVIDDRRAHGEPIDVDTEEQHFVPDHAHIVHA